MGDFINNVTDTLGLTDHEGQQDAIRDAGNQQIAATDKQIAYLERADKRQEERLQPYESFGQSNIRGLQLAADFQPRAPNINLTKYLDYNTGIDPNSAFNPSDPAYRFAVDQGRAAINSQAASQGKLNSAGTLNALQNNRIGLASNFANNRFNQLLSLRQNNFAENQQNAAQASGLFDQILRKNIALQNNMFNQRRDLVGIGQASAANQAANSMNTANNVAGVLGNQGDIRASTIMGRSNAHQNSLQQGTNLLTDIGMMIFSDMRLKCNIVEIGRDDLGGIYEFNYLWDKVKRIGRMAQELIKSRPDAVKLHDSGYLMVTAEFAPRVA